jgi:hypothetical protein
MSDVGLCRACIRSSPRRVDGAQNKRSIALCSQRIVVKYSVVYCIPSNTQCKMHPTDLETLADATDRSWARVRQQSVIENVGTWELGVRAAHRYSVRMNECVLCVGEVRYHSKMIVHPCPLPASSHCCHVLQRVQNAHSLQCTAQAEKV